MWKIALNKQTIESVKNGVSQTVKLGIVWPPNLPKFLELCDGVEDVTESFDRFIERKKPIDYAEFLTRNKVGYQCRTQLAEDKARKLWASTIKKIREKISNGEISIPDPNAKKLENPGKMKATLTREQRNQQLDAQIDEMLKKGLRLYGPHKERHETRD
jgi:hypothetical protein